MLEKSGGGKHQVNVYRINTPNPATDTPYPLPRMRNTVSAPPNPATQSPNGATVAPQLHLTSQELHKGKAPPRKFVSELNSQIKAATEEIDRLKDFGGETDRPRIKELIEKRKQWRIELLAQ